MNDMSSSTRDVREAAVEAARGKVRQLAGQGRTVEQIDRELAGEGLTEQERDVAYLLATYEVGRGSAVNQGAPGYWADVEREIGG